MAEWYALKMPCPISGCSNSAANNAIILDWVCSEDNTTMYICEEGELRCGSWQHQDKVVNWKFDCGDRSEVHENVHYLNPDFEGFNFAMAAAVKNSYEGEAEWIMKLLRELMKQFHQTECKQGLRLKAKGLRHLGLGA